MTRNAAGKNPAKTTGKAQSPATSELSCEVCGQMPEPTKARLTLANVAVMLPIELLVHAAVVETHLPYVAKVLVLTLTATILVIWVAEPSAARMLRGWLHAPALRHRKRLGAAPALWRARTVLKDKPGSLQKLTQALAGLNTNILSIHVHPVAGGVLDEFVLSAPGEVREAELLRALRAGGGADPHVWPTTALAMADGQTGALSLAARIAASPEELPLAVAELLRARIVPADRPPATPRPPSARGDGTVLKIPTAWHGPITFLRPGEPFTPPNPPARTVWPNSPRSWRTGRPWGTAGLQDVIRFLSGRTPASAARRRGRPGRRLGAVVRVPNRRRGGTPAACHRESQIHCGVDGGERAADGLGHLLERAACGAAPPFHAVLLGVAAVDPVEHGQLGTRGPRGADHHRFHVQDGLLRRREKPVHEEVVGDQVRELRKALMALLGEAIGARRPEPAAGGRQPQPVR